MTKGFRLCLAPVFPLWQIACQETCSADVHRKRAASGLTSCQYSTAAGAFPWVSLIARQVTLRAAGGVLCNADGGTEMASLTSRFFPHQRGSQL
ncbi:hypothetical protein VTI74DRAFT_9980 [Chaetomium olivicolor]